MNKKLPGYSALLAFVLLFSNSVKADHIVGSDISYKCIKDSVFKVVYNFYRDCNGCYVLGQSPKCGTSENCGSAQTAPISPALSGIAGSCNGTSFANFTMVRTGIVDITKTCSKEKSRCQQPCNGSYPYGIEKHTFEGTLDLRKYMKAGCCEFRVKFLLYVRSTGITTGQASQSFFTSADINACAATCNNSPILTNDPIGVACCNQPYTFNNGAVDSLDFDSLSFSMASAYSGDGTPCSYSGGLSPDEPVPVYKVGNTINPSANPPIGFYLSKSTGDIVFTPSGSCPWVGIVVIEVKEWRKDKNGKWINIGTTRRDMQITATNCGPNNPPEIKGTQTWTICEGDKITINVKGTDKQFTPHQLKADTVFLTWNRGIPGGTFTVVDPKAREKEANFEWQTKIGDAKDVFYSFTVQAQDDNCPTRGVSVKSFRVKVKKRALDTRKYWQKKCGWLVFEANLDAGFQGVANYKWEIRDSTNLGMVYKLSFGKKDSFQFKNGGKYIVTHTINNNFNCPTVSTDTIIIPPVLDVQLAFAKDTFACDGNDITLVPNIRYGNPNYRYYWARPDAHTSGDTTGTFSLKITQDTTIALRIIDGGGCEDTDTIKIAWKPLPIVDIGPDVRICTYGSYTIDAGHADTMKYLWYPTLDTTRTLKVNIPQKYIVHVIDTWGCHGIDTMELFVNDTVKAKAPADFEICYLDSTKIPAGGFNLKYPHRWQWTNLLNNTLITTDSLLRQKPLGTLSYELYLEVDQSGVKCDNRDTVKVKVNPLPVFTLDQLLPKCYIDGDINLHASTSIKPAEAVFSGKNPSMVTCYGPPVRCFYNTSKLDNSKIGSSGHIDTVYYEYTDANGCHKKEFLEVKINSNPIVVLRDRVYCQDKGVAKMDSSVVRPKSKAGFRFSWEGAKKPGGVNWSDILSNKGSTFVPDWEFDCKSAVQGDYVIRFIIDDAITGCRTIDSCTIKIIEEPVISFNPMPNFCINDDTINLDDYVSLSGGAQILDGVWTAISYKSDRNDSRLPTAIIGGHKFLPSKYFPTGSGLWEIKYYHNATGCPAFDSTYININDLPVVDAMADDTLCTDATPLVLTGSPLGGIWSGTYTSLQGGNYIFTPTSKSQSIYEGPYWTKYVYTDPTTGCINRDSMKLTVQNKPVISITTANPYEQCEGKDFDLVATSQWTNGITWTTNGDGTFTGLGSKSLTTTYKHGVSDTTNGTATLNVATDAFGVCPATSVNIQLIIQKYPEVYFGDLVNGCAPLTVDFWSKVYRVPVGQLTYNWDLGNSQTSTLSDPTGISYNTEGSYNITLKVNNSNGNCETTVSKPNYVNVFPVPVADFTSDPAFYTTIALPKFRFINQSNITTGSLKYLWNFGTGNPNDTSTQKDPVFSYSRDTGEYTVFLLISSDKGCVDSVSKKVKIGPDVTVFIPNVFSPDGSGFRENETFYAVAKGFKTFSMQIFNRWGQKLYETTDILKGWDGKYEGTLCSQDVYVYSIDVVAPDNKTYHFSGTVTLLR